MNRWQKIAWFQLSVVMAAMVVTGIAVWRFTSSYGLVRAWGFGTVYMVLCIFAHLGPLIFRKKKSEIDSDERTIIIDRQAAWIGFGASYCFLVVVCVTALFMTGPDKMVPAGLLLQIVLGGWVTAIVVNAITTLVCYGRGVKDGGQ